MISKGYTLIELMVVVAIIGIISAIAYPSYQGYTCDTYVGQAVADLNVCALGMERHYSNNFAYTGAVIDDAVANSVCPAQSPTDGAAKYQMSVSVPTAQTFIVTATAEAGNSCSGNITINEAGTIGGL